MTTTRADETSPHPSFPWRLTANALALLLAVKVAFFLTSQSQMRSAFLVSYVQDAFLLLACYWLFLLAPKAVPLRHVRGIGRTLFIAATLVLTVFSAAYSFFLLDLVSFPVNLFGVDARTTAFFVEYFLSPALGVALAAGLLVLLGLSWRFPRKLERRRLPVAFAVVITLLFVPTALRPAINPLVYSIQDQLLLTLRADSELVRLRRAVPSADQETGFRFLDRSSEEIASFSSHYDRVVVLVMEGVNHDDFAAACRSDDRLLTGRYAESTISFDNYYTLNLDSYTSLLAMLSSTFVPYQSYVDQKRYEFINQRGNLLDLLEASQYSTHFLTSYGEQQKRFVPALERWTSAHFISDMSEKAEFTCIDSSKIEWACEDLAVFDDLVTILRTTPRPFIFQELVYGHTSSWKEKTGVGTNEYYLEYFAKLIETLEGHGLSDNTLLVLTSDHGPRDNAFDPGNYHVPLLLWATDINQDRNEHFLSHLDFRDLLIAQLSGGSYQPKDSPIFTVGNSGEMIYGRIGRDGTYGFIHNRMRNLRGNMTRADAKEFNRSFQEYMDYFESLRPRDAIGGDVGTSPNQASPGRSRRRSLVRVRPYISRPCLTARSSKFVVLAGGGERPEDGPELSGRDASLGASSGR